MHHCAVKANVIIIKDSVLSGNFIWNDKHNSTSWEFGYLS